MVHIAVIGAGNVGLATAVNIQELLPDAHVTIMADKLMEQTTSWGAAGIFRPGFTSGMPGLPRHVLE